MSDIVKENIIHSVHTATGEPLGKVPIYSPEQVQGCARAAHILHPLCSCPNRNAET